jgi:predicted solute-binding protein
VRLGAVGYLNARPLVYGLEHDSEFDVRYDIPSECARLLHARDTDIGLIPSIEYLRGPAAYTIVPGAGVTSRGPVASVAMYTARDPRDIRTIAMDNSSRTSVALATILLRREYGVSARPVSMPPDLDAMLSAADAALIIGDTALFLEPPAGGISPIAKIDLGQLWTDATGLPFVYAFWAGWPDAVAPEHVERLQRARDEGVARVAEVASAYYPGDARRRAIAREYLRDNIQYFLGPDELEGLQTFYRYAAEQNLVAYDGSLRFYHAEHHGAR